jgi:hypothetical protein
MRAPRTKSALDVYRRLIQTAADLELMADECWSVSGETALRTTAKLVRTLASGFWLSIKPDENQEP